MSALIARRARPTLHDSNASEIAKIKARHSFLKPLTVPAGSYPG